MKKNNKIDPTALIPKNIEIGSYNFIGKNVHIVLKTENCKIKIGDNNIINDNVKIIIDEGECEIGDWNVIHNNTLLLCKNELKIKNNVWVGQNSILDGTGGLIIKNGVRIGMQSQIWSHAKTGEEIEGCILNVAQPTKIEDEVWIQGNCLIGSGISIGFRTIGLLGSVLHQSIGSNKVFKGNPAKEISGLKMYRKVSDKRKLSLMLGWAKDFKETKCNNLKIENFESQIKLMLNSDQIIISIDVPEKINDQLTYFIISNKKFFKTNSILERGFYRYLYSNKARFNYN